MELNLCWNGQLFREGTQTLKQELGPFFFFLNWAGDSFFIRFIHFTLFYK